jgi:hypothetical protein
MPAYYFAITGYHAGDKPDPATDTLIAIQYQKIDLTSAEPLEKMTILPVWESSEQQIVTEFCQRFFRPDLAVTQFIPVGMNLDYAYEMILAKCRLYNLPVITSHQLYYQRPRFDLAPVIVLLNDGRFAGANLDAFSAKKSDAGRINTWYEKKEFKKISQTLREDAERFLKMLHYVSRYKTRLGITRKGETGPKKPELVTPRTRPEKSVPPHPESPGAFREIPEKRAGRRPPASHKSSSPLAKAEPRPSGRAPAGSGSDDRHSSAPGSQFRKHTPLKKQEGKRE